MIPVSPKVPIPKTFRDALPSDNARHMASLA